MFQLKKKTNKKTTNQSSNCPQWCFCLFLGPIPLRTSQILFQILEVTLKGQKQIFWISKLISWGAHTTICSLLNANPTILSTTCATCKPDSRLLPDPEDALAHSQFSNLSAQQCKALLVTSTCFSSRSGRWLSKLYTTGLNSPLLPWARPCTPKINLTAVVCFLPKPWPRKAYAKLNLHRSGWRKKILPTRYS